MANPSTTNPTASGKEVLRRSYKVDLNNTTYKIIDGVADHIYTVLSVVFQNRYGAGSVYIALQVNADGGGTDVKIMESQLLPAVGTFIFSDRIIIAGEDELVAVNETAQDIDVYCSYIDQDFS